MNGLPVLDELGEPTRDIERGTTYPPLKAMNEDKYIDRCGYSDAPKCIFCIHGSPNLNHDIATALKTSFQNKSLQLMKNQIEAEDFIDNYELLNPKEKADMLTPYLQTSLLQDEIVLLEYTVNDGNIRVYETSGRRKDRYSSLSYGNYFIRQREKKLKKKKKSGSINLW